MVTIKIFYIQGRGYNNWWAKQIGQAQQSPVKK